LVLHRVLGLGSESEIGFNERLFRIHAKQGVYGMDLDTQTVIIYGITLPTLLLLLPGDGDWHCSNVTRLDLTMIARDRLHARGLAQTYSRASQSSR
jgi:hypothetical protein